MIDHSIPTRRSSDLTWCGARGRGPTAADGGDAPGHLAHHRRCLTTLSLPRRGRRTVLVDSSLVENHRQGEMTVPRRGLRGVTGMLASALVLALAACATPLPNSVVAGSSTTIGWTHRLTSTNPASTDGATDGNLGVAALTRGHFAVAVDGAAVIDESFGTATKIGRASCRERV